MKKASSWSPKEQDRDESRQDDTVKLHTVKNSDTTGTSDEESKETADSAKDAVTYEDVPIEKKDTAKLAIEQSDMDTAGAMSSVKKDALETSITARLPATPQTAESFMALASTPHRAALPRGRAILLVALLLILVINASTMSFAQFIGPQGWAYVLGGPVTTSNPDLLNTIAKQLHHRPTPGATAQASLFR